MCRVQPEAGVFAITMRHASLLARMIGMPSIVCSVTSTSKWFRARSSTIPFFSSLGSSSPIVSFQASVKGSSSTMNHLGTGEQLASHAQHAYPDRKTKYHHIRDHVVPLIMSYLVMPFAQRHEAQS